MSVIATEAWSIPKSVADHEREVAWRDTRRSSVASKSTRLFIVGTRRQLLRGGLRR